ncbi:MAG: diacylglycerol kinase family lipid kinase [Lachnospiraceae bacterium]|nr:diacylglycerol kinase family lipid kinase [Lachnospiraceae bacterium]
MYHFIVNITSGSGKSRKVWQELQDYLTEHKIRYQAHFTEYEGHGAKLARHICSMEKEHIYLIVVGGDGSLNEVINGMHDFHKIRFGYIPTGSGNDFARGMGLKGTPTEHLERILKAGRVTTPVDLGMVRWGDGKEKLFAISSGVGIDAEVCRQALHSRLKKVLNRIGLGSLTYVCLTVKSLFTMATASVEVKFDDEEWRRIDKMIFVAGMNQYCEGGGVPMAPKANAMDGRLSVCCVWGIPRWKAFFLLPVLVLGRHEKLKGFEIVACQRFAVRIDQEMVLHADGEYCGDIHEAEFICLPEKLHILL